MTDLTGFHDLNLFVSPPIPEAVDARVSETLDRIKQEKWEILADNTGVSVDELKARALSTLNKLETAILEKGDLLTLSEPELGKLVENNEKCRKQDYSISLFDIFGVGGSLEVCNYGGYNWNAVHEAYVLALGSRIWTTSYRFSPQNLSVSYEINSFIATLKLGFNLAIEPGKISLFTNGRVSTWFWGENFNLLILSIPI